MYDYAHIPLDGPDQTLSDTRVYDLVSDKVRSGPLGSPTSSRICLVVDISEQSRHVRILSVGPVGSQTKSVGPCSEFGNDTTRHDTSRVQIQ